MHATNLARSLAPETHIVSHNIYAKLETSAALPLLAIGHIRVLRFSLIEDTRPRCVPDKTRRERTSSKRISLCAPSFALFLFLLLPLLHRFFFFFSHSVTNHP